MSHPTDYYGWMRNGAELYRALARHFYIYDGRNDGQHPLVFETFPHAIACALAGKIVCARDKRVVRRNLLQEFGVACELLTNIDFVDAAVCALAADHFAQGHYERYGDAAEGFIVVSSLARLRGLTIAMRQRRAYK